jgi:hypothetical protein
MSLILDALNRADQERSAQQSTPTVQTVHRAAHSRQRHWRWEHAVIVAMVVVGGVFVLYEQVFSPNTSDSFSSSDSAVVAMPSGSGNIAPDVAVDAAEEVGMVGEASPVKARRVISDDAGRERQVPIVTFVAPDLAPLGAVASDDEASASDRAEEVSRLYRIPAAVPTEVPRLTKEAEALLAAQVARASRSTMAEVFQGEPLDVPYIADLPMQLRRDIPSLNYSEHMPDEQAGEARVRLNGQIMQEGQQVAPELELVTIDEQGIILRFRDVPFRLPVLNRWVNF